MTDVKQGTGHLVIKLLKKVLFIALSLKSGSPGRFAKTDCARSLARFGW